MRRRPASRHIKHMPTRHNARRITGCLLLTAVVSAAHLLLPWAWPAKNQLLQLNKKSELERPPTVNTRQITLAATPTPRAAQATPSSEPAKPRVSAARKPERLDEPPPTLQAAAPPPPESPAPQQSASDELDGLGSLAYAIAGRFAGQQVGGSAKFEWKIGKSAYAITLNATGSRHYSVMFAWELSSQGTVGMDGMRPGSYEETLMLAGEPTKRQTIAFTDSVAGADTAASGTSSQLAAELDPLNALLKLANDLHALKQTPGEAASAGAGFSIAVRLNDRVLNLDFERQADETVESPFGPLHAEKFVTKYTRLIHDEPVITLWLAPELRHAPVRVRVEQQGAVAINFELSSEPMAFPAWW